MTSQALREKYSRRRPFTDRHLISRIPYPPYRTDAEYSKRTINPDADIGIDTSFIEKKASTFDPFANLGWKHSHYEPIYADYVRLLPYEGDASLKQFTKHLSMSTHSKNANNSSGSQGHSDTGNHRHNQNQVHTHTHNTGFGGEDGSGPQVAVGSRSYGGNDANATVETYEALFGIRGQDYSRQKMEDFFGYNDTKPTGAWKEALTRQRFEQQQLLQTNRSQRPSTSAAFPLSTRGGLRNNDHSSANADTTVHNQERFVPSSPSLYTPSLRSRNHASASARPTTSYQPRKEHHSNQQNTQNCTENTKHTHVQPRHPQRHLFLNRFSLKSLTPKQLIQPYLDWTHTRARNAYTSRASRTTQSTKPKTNNINTSTNTHANTTPSTQTDPTTASPPSSKTSTHPQSRSRSRSKSTLRSKSKSKMKSNSTSSTTGRKTASAQIRMAAMTHRKISSVRSDSDQHTQAQGSHTARAKVHTHYPNSIITTNLSVNITSPHSSTSKVHSGRHNGKKHNRKHRSEHRANHRANALPQQRLYYHNTHHGKPNIALTTNNINNNCSRKTNTHSHAHAHTPTHGHGSGKGEKTAQEEKYMHSFRGGGEGSAPVTVKYVPRISLHSRM